MKLLYLANLRLPSERAFGVQIAKTCEALAEKNVEVTLIYPYRRSLGIHQSLHDYYSVKENFKAKQLFAPDFYLPGILDRAAFYAKNLISSLILTIYAVFQRADVFYSRDEWPLLFLSAARRKNLYFEAHRFSRPKKWLYILLRKAGVKIIAISTGLKKEFLKLGLSTDDILTAPDGVDLSEFEEKITKEEARKRANLPLDRKIIMYTGHLFEWKGAGILLQVARNFQFSRPNDRHRSVGRAIFNSPAGRAGFQTDNMLFVFVGGTERDVGSFREKAGWLNNVLILGHRPHKEIPSYLKAADVLVLPNSAKEEISRVYTSPLKLFEYMASGRPIVASDLPSIREILNDQNSVLIQPDDPEKLAEGIRKVIGDQELSSRLASRALQDVQLYTWQKRAEKVIDFITNADKT